MNRAIMERIWKELLPDSPWAEEIRKEARESALAELRRIGQQEGELRQARRGVAQMLRNCFPGVSCDGIEAVADLAKIDRAIDDLFQAQSEEEARATITRLLT